MIIEKIDEIPATPGNYGGETLREYCGLSRFRVDYAFKARYDEGCISAQRLYIAIMNAKKRARSRPSSRSEAAVKENAGEKNLILD